jgi:hypothetical protein
MKHGAPTVTWTDVLASGDVALSVSPCRDRPPASSPSAIHAPTLGL